MSVEISPDDMVPGRRYNLNWDDSCTDGRITGTFVGVERTERPNEFNPEGTVIQILMRFTDVEVEANGFGITEANR